MVQDAHEMMPQEMWVNDIHISHPGVTRPVSEAICEAAAVCLDRHHQPPKSFSVSCHGEKTAVSLQWVQSSARAKAAHHFEYDATKDGAYAVCLLCVECRMGLVAAGQAPIGTGADWYVGPPEKIEIDEDGFPNLDAPGMCRLEVSGVDKGPIGGRVTKKKKQAADGDSFIPGLAGVVGFERAVVRIESADAGGGLL